MSQLTLPFDGSADRRCVPSPTDTASATRADRCARRAAGAMALPAGLTGSPIAYVFVRSLRARRYVLRLRPDGVVRITIPRRGSRREALDVIDRQRQWIERQWRIRMAQREAHEGWDDGTRILFRGLDVRLTVRADADGRHVCFADQVVGLSAGVGVRHAVEGRLRELAQQELEPRLRGLAEAHGLVVQRVRVRSQRTRWGSCSRSGSISLNWRLVQMPPSVADYILLHELMHLRQADHSRRFWREVEGVCPNYREAEAWLRRRGQSLW